MRLRIFTFAIFMAFCFTLASFAELTENDLLKIREIVRGEVEVAILASERRTREYIDLQNQLLRQEIKALDEKLTGQIKALDQKIEALDEKLTGQIEALDQKTAVQFEGVQKQFEAQNQKFDIITVVLVGIFTLIAGILGLIGALYLMERRDRKEELETKKSVRELQEKSKNDERFIQQLQGKMEDERLQAKADREKSKLLRLELDQLREKMEATL